MGQIRYRTVLTGDIIGSSRLQARQLTSVGLSLTSVGNVVTAFFLEHGAPLAVLFGLACCIRCNYYPLTEGQNKHIKAFLPVKERTLGLLLGLLFFKLDTSLHCMYERAKTHKKRSGPGTFFLIKWRDVPRLGAG
jgi:hypothetical protein